MRPSIAMPAIVNSWTQHGRYTTAPTSVLGLHPVARELLLISRPAEGRRLSWLEHTVDQQLAQCLRLDHESDAL